MARLKKTMLLLLLFQFISSVHSTTVFRMVLDSYSDSEHKVIDGTCCDDPSEPCIDSCDTRFVICVDSNTTSYSFDSCDIGDAAIEQQSVLDPDDFDFPDIASNTLQFSALTAWTGSYRVKVQIWDVDPGLDQKVNEIFEDVDQDAAPFSVTPPIHIINMGTATMQLKFSPKVQCETDFYGSDCFTHCVAQDDPGGHYTCNIWTGDKLCLDGWAGDDCDEDYDECSSDPCLNGALCINGSNKYNCTCLEGFTGIDCETNVDDCTPTSCKNNGTCLDLIDDYQCLCPEGFSGHDCNIDIDECASSPCENGGSCEDVVAGFICHCPYGYDGYNCSQDIDECNSSPCLNNATCVDGIGNFTCLCLPGFSGLLCYNETDYCASDPCMNGGTCRDDINGSRCECLNGFEGTNCQIESDECSSNPCFSNATCLDEVDRYTCHCQTGFNGTLCEDDIDECLNTPCQNGATCENTPGGFTCWCVYGYEGIECEMDIDECGSSPCINNSTCVDALGAYHCECLPGFNGTNCELHLDECSSHPCLNSGTCQDAIDGYRCLCLEGYEGETCSEETNFCSSLPCNTGQCIPEFNGYRCDCDKLHTGKHCETVIPDPCSLEPCVKGKCEASTTDDRGYECTCDVGYFGKDCEIELSIYGYIIIVFGAFDFELRFEFGMAAILEAVLLELGVATAKREAVPVAVTVATLVDLVAVPSGEDLTEVTFVAIRDNTYMTSERIGELLANKSKESIETQIGYEIYYGDTELPPDWMFKYWYVVVIGVVCLCLSIAVISYIVWRLQTGDKDQVANSMKDDLEMDGKEQPMDSPRNNHQPSARTEKLTTIIPKRSTRITPLVEPRVISTN